MRCTVLASGLIPFSPYHSGVPAKDHRGLTLTRQVARIRSGCLDKEVGDHLSLGDHESYFHFDEQVFNLQSKES